MQQTCPQIKYPLLKCSSGKNARIMCTNPTCTQYNFICDTENCQKCDTKHSQCKSCWLQPILKYLKQKRKVCPFEIMQASKTVGKIYDQAIDNIKSHKEKLLLQFQFYGLSETEAYYTKLILDKRQDLVHGDLTSRILKELKSNHELIISQTQSLNFWKAQKKEFDNVLTGLDTFFRLQKLEIQSKILPSPLKEFNKMFDTNVIKATLLYRASEEKFSMINFYQKCSSKRNLLILALTKERKIFGGFTPLSFSKVDYARPVVDISVQSFLFSYQQSELFKFQLTQPNNAIYQDPNGIIFGSGNDMYIPDQADKVLGSYNIGSTYCYKGEIPEGKDQNTLFRGNANDVLLGQWQVFELQFCPELKFKMSCQQFSEFYGVVYGEQE